ncbi:MAG: hypothetical protein ABR501_11215 [Pyrinomonadaceae bacterium]
MILKTGLDHKRISDVARGRCAAAGNESNTLVLTAEGYTLMIANNAPTTALYGLPRRQQILLPPIQDEGKALVTNT